MGIADQLRAAIELDADDGGKRTEEAVIELAERFDALKAWADGVHFHVSAEHIGAGAHGWTLVDELNRASLFECKCGARTWRTGDDGSSIAATLEEAAQAGPPAG